MDRSVPTFVNTDDVKQQLVETERRYAEVRASVDKARAELREISARKGSSPISTSAARGRFEALADRCRRLRDHIDLLEDRLDD
jgi:predicted  nucleic acid-binding Zn-ribbon protein